MDVLSCACSFLDYLFEPEGVSFSTPQWSKRSLDRKTISVQVFHFLGYFFQVTVFNSVLLAYYWSILPAETLPVGLQLSGLSQGPCPLHLKTGTWSNCPHENCVWGCQSHVLCSIFSKIQRVSLPFGHHREWKKFASWFAIWTWWYNTLLERQPSLPQILDETLWGLQTMSLSSQVPVIADTL